MKKWQPGRPLAKGLAGNGKAFLLKRRQYIISSGLWDRCLYCLSFETDFFYAILWQEGFHV